MKQYFLTFRSITPAQRGEYTLRRAGITCELQRTPRFMAEKGCGYCLRLRRDDTQRAVQLLRAQQVPFSRLLFLRPDGVTEVIPV